MQKASLLETYEPFLGGVTVEEFIAGGNVEHYFAEHWQQATVATLGDEIVGVAVLLGALLDLIWVEPSVRSNGIGSALMEEAERQAPVESTELTLEVWRVNRRAVEFYRRLGFSVRETTEDPLTGLEKLVMRRNAKQTS